MTQDMYASVGPAIDEVTADPGLRVLILRGAGTTAFGAGSDIGEFRERRVGEGAFTYADIEHRAIEAILAVPVPVIAAIHGPCMGGGLLLASCADLRIAAADAAFSAPPARLGIGFPADGAERLRNLIGASAAKDMLFTARVVEADEALRLGLVNTVVAKAELDDHVAATAQRISRLAPLSIRAAKLAVDGADPEMVADAIADCVRSEDYREGVAAFLEKRHATFTGR